MYYSLDEFFILKQNRTARGFYILRIAKHGCLVPVYGTEVCASDKCQLNSL